MTFKTINALRIDHFKRWLIERSVQPPGDWIGVALVVLLLTLLR